MSPAAKRVRDRLALIDACEGTPCLAFLKVSRSDWRTPLRILLSTQAKLMRGVNVEMYDLEESSVSRVWR